MLTDNKITDWAQFMRPNGGKLATTLALLEREVGKRMDGDTTPLRLYIDGPTGAGKTTLARLIAAKLGCPAMELDGTEVTPEALDSLKGNAFMWRVLVINEAQNVTAHQSKRLMSAMDAMGKRACIVFTTMEQSTKSKPLFADFQQDRAITDRCFEVHLTTQGMKSPENVAKVLGMARESGLDYGANERAIENLFEAECNSIRGVLSAISKGALVAA